MKRFVAASIAVVLAFAPARAATGCPPPRCITVTVPVTPGFLVPDNRVNVILPAGYDPAQTYPVLYLLHGAGGSFHEWTDNTDIVSFSSAYRIIIAMPDSGGTPNSGWYADWIDGSRQWESFHIKDVIPYIESTFHGNGHRAIAGLSMGGYGAMYYAAKYPSMFKAAGSFSGAVDIRLAEPVTGVAFDVLHDFEGTPNDKVWGNQVLEDMARVIRTFRPNVVINGWGGVHGGHGHHQAAGLLTPKAVQSAADSSFSLPGSASEKKDLIPWGDRKPVLVLDVDRSEKPQGYLLPLDETSPLYGKTWREVGLDAFANHRTQGITGFLGSPFLRRPVALKREDGGELNPAVLVRAGKILLPDKHLPA